MTDWKELYSIELQKNMRLTTENVSLKKKLSDIGVIIKETPNNMELGDMIRQLSFFEDK
tara:strand:+ start:890 stop:1066 length:177 start_codon:yes stop_codon:yes gene_type:complete